MKKQAKLASKEQTTVVRKDSPFKKYTGIGNPGIPSGRKGIKKWLRGSRGELDGE
jgi:hypothetical protein